MSASSDYINFYLAHMPKPRPAPPFYVQKHFYPGCGKDYRRRVEIEISESRKRIDAYEQEFAEFRESLRKHFPLKGKSE